MIYVETVEHVADIEFVLVGKYLASVKILVSSDAVVGKLLHDDAEQVFIAVDDILRIVE